MFETQRKLDFLFSEESSQFLLNFARLAVFKCKASFYFQEGRKIPNEKFKRGEALH